MKSIHVTTTSAGMDSMKAAAEYEELPLSLWARTALLKEARAVAHKKLCATVKKEQPVWAGKPCTQKEYDEFSKNSRAMNPAE